MSLDMLIGLWLVFMLLVVVVLYAVVFYGLVWLVWKASNDEDYLQAVVFGGFLLWWSGTGFAMVWIVICCL